MDSQIVDDAATETLTYDPEVTTKIEDYLDTDEAAEREVEEAAEVAEAVEAEEVAEERRQPGAFRRWLQGGTRAKIEELQAEVAQLEEESEVLQALLAQSEKNNEELAAAVEELQAKAEEVVASTDKRVADAVVEEVAAVGFAPADLPEASADPMDGASIRERYDAIEDPRERFEFYRKHKAALINGPIEAASA